MTGLFRNAMPHEDERTYLYGAREDQSMREALFGIIGDEQVEISEEMAKGFDRMLNAMHRTYTKEDYDSVPF